MKKEMWVMIDLSNSDLMEDSTIRTMIVSPKLYAWVFNTRDKARKHRNEQERLPFGARLSLPFKMTVYN